MHYLIARDGQQLGQFSEEEVRSGLFEGRYLPTDVAWTEGMSDWQPLGELLGPGVTRVSAPRAAAAAATSTGWTATTQTAGLAITTLVLGIISFLTCGGLGVGAIATIVCGHLALSSIGKSRGTLGGKGMALAGLIMGYVSVVTLVVAVAAPLVTAGFSRMGEKGIVIKANKSAFRVMTAMRLYAVDNGGNFPESLERLVSENLIEKEEMEELQRFKPQGWSGEAGFEYRGAGMTDQTAGNKIVMLSRCWDAKNRRIKGTADGAVELTSRLEE